MLTSSFRQSIALFLCVVVVALPSHARQFSVSVITDGLEHPWGMEVMPDGRVLVTERAGRMRIVDEKGTLSNPVKNVPAVYYVGQGGLLDVALSPDFEHSKRIFFSYAEAEDDNAGTAVASATLDGTSLKDVTVIFRQTPKVHGENHFGSRLAFAPDGNLFITLGERFDYRDQAQLLDNHLGKVVRIAPDGSIPDDNPYADGKGGLPEIWSLGHRNIQGAAMHPQTGELWIHEHGPKGGDEINIPKPRGNYGWPQASYGIHYWLAPIKDDHVGQGFIEPIHHWTPSIAPSGMLFYTGKAFPEWQGNIFIGALAGRHLQRLTMNGETVMSTEKLLLERGERIRDVAQDASGNLLLLTDAENGALLRVSPAE
jgi:glucose/arabinose dehydrogenase